MSIADKRFAPFWQAAEETGAAVFVHALHPAGTERLVGPPGLAALVAFPCETAVAIASLMVGGTLARHPRLRIAFSHGGGVFGLVLPRLMHGWNAMRELKETAPQSPAEQARRLFYDTLVYDPATLAFLIEPAGAVEALGLPERERGLLLSGNPCRFLGDA